MAPRRTIEINPGDVYGFGVVIEETSIIRGNGHKERAARLRCTRCGNIYTASLGNLHRKTQQTVSCGCYHYFIIKTKEPTIIIKHGLSQHPDYQRWVQMMARCYKANSPNYERYGGRGIEVCQDWHDVENFIEWLEDNLGPCPRGWTMDRIDNDGDYEPGNVRWASSSLQRRNQRRYIRRHGSTAPSPLSRAYWRDGVDQVMPTPGHKKKLLVPKTKPSTTAKKKLLVRKPKAVKKTTTMKNRTTRKLVA